MILVLYLKIKNFAFLSDILRQLPQDLLYYIEFDDYDSIELLTVFKNMCVSKGYIISEGILDKVKELIDFKKANDPQSFGNARGVRNIFEKIEINQMSRLGIKSEITNEELMTITIEDIP